MMGVRPGGGVHNDRGHTIVQSLGWEEINERTGDDEMVKTDSNINLWPLTNYHLT